MRLNTVLLAIALCTTACGKIQPVADATIDCLGENRPAIDNLLTELKPLITAQTMSWDGAYQRSKQAGIAVGACVIKELVNWYLSGTKAPPDGALAYDTAERFIKTEAKGATVLTMCKKEDGTMERCKL